MEQKPDKMTGLEYLYILSGFFDAFEKIFMIVRKKGIWRRTYIKNR